MYINKLIILVILVVSIFIFSHYYKNHQNKSIVFSYTENLLPLVIVKNNNIEIYEDELYYPIYNLNIYSKSNVNTKYVVNDNQYLITVSNEYGTIDTYFNYAYKPKEVIEVIKEVYIENNEPINNNHFSNNTNKNLIEGIKDIELPLDSDIHTLNYLLTKDIVTSHQITIDYAEVNLSKTGKYKVYYYTNNQKYECYVTIY